MRIRRKQKTLWRIGFLPLLDVLVLCFAALHFAGGPETPGGFQSTFTLKQQDQVSGRGVPVTISIEPDGALYLDGIPTEIAELRSRLSDSLRVSGGSHVTVEPAPGATIGVIDWAVSAAQAAGARSFSLIAQNTGIPD